MIKRLLSIFSVVAVTAAFIGAAQTAVAAPTADTSAVGYWITKDHNNHDALSSVIKITKGKDGTLSGKIVHIFPENGHKATDKCMFCKGALHNAPIQGLKILWGFTKTGPGQYANGHVLDPQSGKIYKCKMWLSQKGQLLTVHGYIGISIIGRSDVWYRTHLLNTAK